MFVPLGLVRISLTFDKISSPSARLRHFVMLLMHIANFSVLLRFYSRYERVHNRLAILEVLIKSESEYVKILVGKILALTPDIVIVQRTVSGLAQVLLSSYVMKLSPVLSKVFFVGNAIITSYPSELVIMHVCLFFQSKVVLIVVISGETLSTRMVCMGLTNN